MHMKQIQTFKKGMTLFVIALLLQNFCFAQTWPTASQQASELTIGWNIGNSLEVPDGETAWGNAATSQQLINAVKAAGFNMIRIPCAWNSYADQSTLQISSAWLERVAEVVNYGINNDMYVILNSHWDRGWLEENPTYNFQEEVNQKQEAYWTQVANHFKDYGPKLLFAGTNEVRANYGTPTSEHIEVQESYNQTFVNAVRATGGNNRNRNLIVQFYNTNYWHGLNYFTPPTDVVNDHLYLEAHHYDPYDFTLNPDNNAACILWGSPWAGGDVCSWGQEGYTDDLFGQIKTRYVDQGYPIIMGEYGVVKRTSLSGSDQANHLASRLYYLEYVTRAAKENGIIPVYWDNGYSGDQGFALFDRSSGNILDQDAIDALMEGAGEDGDGDGPDTSYELTTNIIGQGTISLSPSSGVYDPGTNVTLTATPSQGYSFSSWSGSLSGNNNPATVAMNSNLSVTATFVEDQTGGEPCDNPTNVSLPFTQEGSGEFCFAISGDISYVNSWAMEALEINGEDYANKWSNSFPAKINGNYYVYFKGSQPWSHFEANAPGSSRVSDLRTNIETYPNPFNQSMDILMDHPEQVKRIVILDLLGKVVSDLTQPILPHTVKVGAGLDPGLYILQVHHEQGIKEQVIKKK